MPSSEDTDVHFNKVAKSKTFRNIVNTFELNKKSVLDIGCGNGAFLAHFGPGSVGVTIISEEVDYAREKSLDVRLGNIESNDFQIAEKFDVVFSNNLFEHLLSPHMFMIKIKNYLKEDGLLILGVPCIPKIVWLMRFNKFRGSLAGAHINFFTKDTLVKSVEKGGWKVLGVRGFHFYNKFIDRLINLIYPHFYVSAKIDKDFKYTEKRMKELNGYMDFKV